MERVRPSDRLSLALSDEEVSRLRYLSRMTRTERQAELQFRGWRAVHAVARELDAPFHFNLGVTGKPPPLDIFHRGWIVKVRSFSVAFQEPVLWFREYAQKWDGAVLVAHMPDVERTVWVCGWIGRTDWHLLAREHELWGKRVWAVGEEALRPFSSLNRATPRWECPN